MSLATLLERRTVPPVPPEKTDGGTDKTLANQGGSPGSPSSPEKTRWVTQNGNPGPSAPPPATPGIRHSQRRTIQINESGGTGEPSAAEILNTLSDQGLTVALDGDRLTVSPSSRLTDPMRAEIRQHKAELVALLAANDGAVPDPPPLSPDDQAAITEAVEERAAILEFDAGMERRQAEARAASAMRVFRALIAMPNGQPPRWLVLLAPGCDLVEARQTLAHKFGAERVMEVIEHQAEGARHD